jgi:hypothetical protein|tara:strand:+ start:4124 stop:4987 length:864 start_codon:yes stop_codon:yes gene_type:complete
LVEAKILRRWLTDRENDGAEEAMRVMAEKTAVVVLQGAAEDPEEQEFVLEAVCSRLVANVIRYPLVKQNTFNLWQHAVRKMIQDKSNAKMLATLKRSSSVAMKHNFERPFCHGTTGDPQAMAEARLRSPTPPLRMLSVEAMNARQAQLLLESEAKKENQRSAPSAAKAKQMKRKSEHLPGMAAVPSTPAPALCDNAPSKGAFDDVSMPIGLRLAYSDSFIKLLSTLAPTDTTALSAAARRPHADHGTNTSVPDDAPMSEDYDALDYVLNSNDFSLDVLNSFLREPLT